LALTNLKRSGFVFITDDLILKNIEHKTKCRCFFDAREIVQKAHCWIDKALWVLWRSKVPCPRGRERKKSKCVQTIFSKGISTSYYQKDADPETSEQHEDLQQ